MKSQIQIDSWRYKTKQLFKQYHGVTGSDVSDKQNAPSERTMMY